VSVKTSDKSDILPFCFLSNKKIGERCNGISERTVGRSLSQLVKAGFIRMDHKGNGKRFARSLKGKLVPVASHIDLSPLHEHIERLDFYKSEIKGEAEALEIWQRLADGRRFALIAQLEERGKSISLAQRDLLDKIKTKRPSRLKATGLADLEACMDLLEEEVQSSNWPPVPVKLAACGSQNVSHKEPEARYAIFDQRSPTDLATCL
jgi:DNA-binding transcriptional ArsR family regulator